MPEWSLDALLRKLYRGNIPHVCWLQIDSRLALCRSAWSALVDRWVCLGSVSGHPALDAQYGSGQNLGCMAAVAWTLNPKPSIHILSCNRPTISECICIYIYVCVNIVYIYMYMHMCICLKMKLYIYIYVSTPHSHADLYLSLYLYLYNYICL